jgi:uncharacterized protein YaiL (DUF2058 family)
MSDSIRKQLLGLGFKPGPEAAKPAKPPASRKPPGKSAQAAAAKHGAGHAPRRPREDMDLAKAYAIRAQREKDERIAAEAARQQAARERREAQARLAALLDGKALNVADADVVRHFEYGGKIKRIHVTEQQLRALNEGQLGVVQVNGRYVLVEAAVLAAAEAVYAPAIALKVDPLAPAAADPYADPRYQVPDDLIW